jgi:hypothetical protein
MLELEKHLQLIETESGCEEKKTSSLSYTIGVIINMKLQNGYDSIIT